ncbi:hypothetical protein FACS189413_14630 [Bacteroidia bacterium]|nr:hypothetical protein FACS189413_14630 [Bacteroidia bacterium]
MKKIITNILLLAALSVSAQSEVLLDDFESGNKGWADVNPGWVELSIVDNPRINALNQSAKVMRVVRKPYVDSWAGIILRDQQELVFGALPGQYRYARVKILKTSSADVTLKLEKTGDAGSFSNTQSYTGAGEWQELIFDLGGAAGKSYDDFFIMPDRTENLQQELIVYIDDIVFQTDPEAVEPGDPELPGEFHLLWQDEFDGDTYDHTIWSPQIAGDGFGNHELQYYTGNTNNIFTRDGNLVLKAIKENYNGHAYTSGKLWTQNFKNFTYGRVEARFKLPKGRGTWPAIWMMPKQNVYGGWPNSGEIDIMEFVGYDANTIYGTVHREAGSGSNGAGNNISFDGNANDYQIIRIDWEPGYIKWYLDDQLFYTYTNGYAGSAQWPFNQDFYVILNFAVGGDWGGAQGVDGTIWPQEFLIDYVRVYQKTDVTPIVNISGELFSVLSRSKNEWEVCSQSSKPIVVDVYSLSGQKQLSQKLCEGTHTMNVSSLPQGVYIITVYNGEKSFVRKIIK